VIDIKRLPSNHHHFPTPEITFFLWESRYNPLNLLISDGSFLELFRREFSTLTASLNQRVVGSNPTSPTIVFPPTPTA
jgi:hypothetical protein